MTIEHKIHHQKEDLQVHSLLKLFICFLPRLTYLHRLSEEQREMRSVFVSQLSARVTDRELSNFFERQAGKVREAKVITDRISRRSKGFVQSPSEFEYVLMISVELVMLNL